MDVGDLRFFIHVSSGKICLARTVATIDENAMTVVGVLVVLSHGCPESFPGFLPLSIGSSKI